MDKRTNKEIREELINAQCNLIELRARATGRTTRIVDEIIQRLFNNPDSWIEVFDHWNDRRSHRFLVDRIKGRLNAEHHADIIARDAEDGGYFIKLKNKPNTEQREREIERLEKVVDELKTELKDRSRL